MEDFTALAEKLSTSVGDARGVLILSRDGLVLGAHPADAEGALKPAWLRFAALGEPERGFLQFGTEIWSYLRRGAYAAFVVSGTSVRPGLVIDQIELALLAAEESRAKRDGLRPEAPAAAAPAAPVGKPRSPLHPEPRPAEDVPMVIHAQPAAQTTERQPKKTSPAPAAADESSAHPAPPEPEGSASSGEADVWGGSSSEEEGEIDRFSLAREFSQLLQEDDDGADG